MMKAKETGFTLIELMMVILIIGILSAIAIPNYQGYLRRTTCEDAKATLIGAANVLERFRAQNNTYVNPPLAASGYTQSPVDGAAQFTIAVNPAATTTTSYLLTATPTATGRLAGRGTLTLTSAGVRAATGDLNDPPGDAAAAVNVWVNGCAGL